MPHRKARAEGPDSQLVVARQRRWLIRGWSLLIFAILVTVWQASGRVLNPIVISTPSAIVSSIFKTFLHGPYGSLAGQLGVSLIDLGAGFGSALVVGITTGLLIGNSQAARHVLEPVVALGNSSPTIAILPLMIIWLGLGHPARILFIGVVSVWAIIINTSVGARVTRQRYRDLGVAFEVPKGMFIARVIVPGTLPYILTGVRVALAHAIVAMIISGQEIGQNGIGGLASQYGAEFRTGEVFGVIVITTVVALLLYRLVEEVRRRTCPWVRWVS